MTFFFQEKGVSYCLDISAGLLTQPRPCGFALLRFLSAAPKGGKKGAEFLFWGWWLKFLGYFSEWPQAIIYIMYTFYNNRRSLPTHFSYPCGLVAFPTKPGFIFLCETCIVVPREIQNWVIDLQTEFLLL